MIGKLVALYKIPLLTSLTLAIALIAIKTATNPVVIVFIVVGTLLGTFVLDLDYLIYALFLEPEADFSRTVSAYIKHHDIPNLMQYIQYHKNEMGEKTLQSIVFQIVLAGAAIFVTSAATGYFVKALVLSIYANSIYRLTQLYLTDCYADWFWALKNKPSKQQVVIFISGLALILVYCFAIF